MKKRRLLLLIALVALATLAFLFGWTPRERTWQTATGWQANTHPAPSTQLFAPRAGAMHTALSSPPTIHWLGHAGFWIKWADQNILLDPNLQNRITLSARFIAPPTLPAEQTFDLICISHAHYDHLSPATLKTLGHIGEIILPKKSETYLNIPLPGTPTITGLDRWESTTVGPLTITAVPAKHNGCRQHPWRSPYIALGYVISDGKNTLYFAGDTAYQPEAFIEIKNRLHPQTAILPIGAYAPRIPFKIHHIDPREAVLSALDLEVTQTIPCHFGTYRLTLDAPSTALPTFAKEAAKETLHWIMPMYVQ